jgi:hypothetical protein
MLIIIPAIPTDSSAEERCKHINEWNSENGPFTIIGDNDRGTQSLIIKHVKVDLLPIIVKHM